MRSINRTHHRHQNQIRDMRFGRREWEDRFGRGVEFGVLRRRRVRRSRHRSCSFQPSIPLLPLLARPFCDGFVLR
ncbi:hypothetical protein ACSBR1_013972 [Camellia fascicularis]